MYSQDLTTFTDEELLDLLITHSDKQALIILFDRYAASLYNFILSSLGSCKPKNLSRQDTTQHILIDIFTSLWNSHKTLKVPTTIRAYLFSTAFNKASHRAGCVLFGIGIF